MNIFCDLHHSGLAYSLRLLLEKRLGHNLFFPVGLDWALKGYWLIHKPYNYSMDTAKQYLSLDQLYRPIDGTLPLNQIAKENPAYYEIKDLAHGDSLKAISFEQFKMMQIDAVIASIPDHWKSFRQLINDHKPDAKLIYQLGNVGWHEHELLKAEQLNLMASVKSFPIPPSTNVVFYHQEIPVLDFVEPPVNPKIKSFVHLNPAKEIFEKYKRALPDVEFKSFGAGCPDGYVNGFNNMVKEIRDSSMVFHVKPMGDGFGHVWHSAYMLGRLTLSNLSDYKDKLGGLLFTDLETGIDLEKRPFEENISIIKDVLENRPRLLTMARKSYQRFRDVVDYQKESEEIDVFLHRLI